MSSPLNLEGINSNVSYELLTLSRVNTKVNYDSSNINWLYDNFSNINLNTLIDLNNSNVINSNNIYTIRNNTLPQITFDINNRIRTYINVKDYGATGNGTTNDYTSINNAVSALPANDGILYFPRGTYSMGTPLTLTSKNRVIIKSDDATIKVSHGGAGIVLVSCHFCNIEGRLNFVSNATSTTSHFGIYTDECNSPTIKNCNVSGDFEIGILAYRNVNSTYKAGFINNNTITGCRQGITVWENNEYTIVENNYIQNCLSSTNGYGINCRSGNVNILNNVVYNCRIGIRQSAISYTNADHASINNNYLISNTCCGIYLNALDYSETICNNVIIGGTGGTFIEPVNATADTFDYCIYIENSFNVILNGNIFFRGQVGLGLDGVANSQISNNLFISDGGTITEHHIREFGETGRNFSNNTFINNIFTGALKVATTENIAFFSSNNGTLNFFRNNGGSTTVSPSTSLSTVINVNSGSYNLYRKEYTVVDVSIVGAVNTSTTPADQTANINITTRLLGIPFIITFMNPSATRATWFRFASTVAIIAPTITSAFTSAITYDATNKAFKVVNLNYVKLIPIGTGNFASFYIC